MARPGKTLRNFEDVALDHLELGKRMLVLGPTRSGKTNMVLHLMKLLDTRERKRDGRGLQFAMAMSKTEVANGNYGGRGKGDYRVVPSYLAFDEIDLSLLATFYEYQKRAKHIEMCEKTMIILDDVLCDRKTANNKVVKEGLMNARNYDVGMVVGGHGCKQMQPEARDQFRFVVAFDLGSRDEVHKLWSLFFSSSFRTFAPFYAMYRKVMKQGQYWALVIDLDADGDVTNRVFKWKAPRYKTSSKDTKPGLRCPHICSAPYWWIMKAAYKDDMHVDPRDLFNLDLIRAKKGLGAPRARDIQLHEEDDDNDVMIV